MLSMQNWLKSESEQNQNVLKATGTERKAYLEKWMVMQSREKKQRLRLRLRGPSVSATKIIAKRVGSRTRTWRTRSGLKNWTAGSQTSSLRAGRTHVRGRATKSCASIGTTTNTSRPPLSTTPTSTSTSTKTKPTTRVRSRRPWAVLRRCRLPLILALPRLRP